MERVYAVVLFCYNIDGVDFAQPDGRIGRTSKPQEPVNPAPLNGENQPQ